MECVHTFGIDRHKRQADITLYAVYMNNAFAVSNDIYVAVILFQLYLDFYFIGIMKLLCLAMVLLLLWISSLGEFLCTHTYAY